MWWIILVIYLVSAVLSWGMCLGKIRRTNPNGLYCPPWDNSNFRKWGYDIAIVRAIAGPAGMWYSFKYENGMKYGLRWR